MFARSTCRLIKLNSALTTGLHRSGYQQCSRNALQHRLMRPPSMFHRVFCQKPATTTPADVNAWRALLNNLFGKYLLATNTISSGLLMVIGDILAQELQCHICTPTDQRYDWKRLGRMFIVGALQGPLHHYVYNWMDKVMPVANLRNIGRKILIDQLIMSPLCIFIFFYSACYLEHKSLNETNCELLKKFPYIYMIDWTIWPAAQFVNFRYLETKYRVIYVNVVTALYNVFMSYMKHEFKVDHF